MSSNILEDREALVAVVRETIGRELPVLIADTVRSSVRAALADTPTLRFRRERHVEREAFDREHVRRADALLAAGPAFAEAKRLVLADAQRRGVMHQIRWIDVGLASGELFPLAPPRFEAPGPDVAIQSGNALRR